MITLSEIWTDFSHAPHHFLKSLMPADWIPSLMRFHAGRYLLLFNIYLALCFVFPGKAYI